MNLGLPEIIVIGIVALLIFGPSRLPELSRALGRGMREFRKAVSEIEDRIETESEAPPPKAGTQDALPASPDLAPAPTDTPAVATPAQPAKPDPRDSTPTPE